MKKRKFKRRTVVIFGVLAVIAVALGAFAVSGNFRKGRAAQQNEITAVKLSKTSIRDTMSLSGTVYSDTTENVYSTLTYPVKEIYAEVGDRVKAGDVLAVLDVKDLEFELRQAENNYDNALASATEDERSLIQNRADSSYSLRNAGLNLEKANENYETQKRELEQLTSSKLVTEQKNIDNAATALENAKTTLESRKKDYENNKRLYEAGGISRSELDSSESAYKTAQTDLSSAEASYNNSVKNYEAVKNTLETELQTAKREVESASLSYQNAQSSYENAQSKISTSEFSLENQLISLEKLRGEYEDAEIKAGIDGVVTAVNAVVGQGASGILFVIEDDTDLYVEVYVKEYNLSKVAQGQSAIITSDATDVPLSGEVAQIAPKAAEGSEGTTVEFETRVKIKDVDERLKIGMNAFAAIITGEAEDVFAVSGDSLVRGRGGYSVYAVENGIVTEVPVTVGLETATSTEIVGDLREGMLILTNPAGVTVGEAVEATVLETSAGFIRGANNPGGEPDNVRIDGSGGGQGAQAAPGETRTIQRGGPAGGPPPMN